MGGYTIVYGLINFAILAAALYFIGKGIVKKTYLEHRNRIANDLENAKKGTEEAAAMQTKLEKRRAEGEASCSETIENAKKLAQDNSAEMSRGNENAVEGIKASAENDAEQLRRDLRRKLTNTAAADITEASAKVLREKLSADSEAKLLERFKSGLASVVRPTPSDRAYVAENGRIAVTIYSAEKLDKAYVAQIGAIVEKAFGLGDVDVEEVLDGTVIGGAVLRVGDTLYDGTLSGMLDRLKRSLEEGDALGDDLKGELSKAIDSADTGIEMFQIGRVDSLSDGICRVKGISDAMAGEMLRFAGDLRGMVLDLDNDNVGVVLLGDYGNVHEGDEVRCTGRIIEVPVGDSMIGRVVDALGRPVDGKGLIHATAHRPIESPAPAVVDRKSVSVPLQTGIKAIDALVPIGRGQRELIIGDRQTGKTAIAIDAIINQKGKGVLCIYVAVGQKESTVASVVEKLRSSGAMSYTTVVTANASEPAPMQYIAPYSGAAIGEFFMYSGRDVLIVYDDLSKQAVAYREVSLLLHRPPGREAYPGDVFYLHSRLLERAARLSPEKGGGSMTALPIIETQAGDISAYIPTNVISITDGQIFLETELFNEGIRPAINSGLSVSRVGGAAQLGAMKQVAGRLRMDMAQYRELAAFMQFGAELDKATKATLDRGERMTEVLKQGRYAPMSAPDQVIAIFAVNEGFADGISTADIVRFESELVPFVNRNYPEFEAIVMTGKKLDKAQLDKLRSVIGEFVKSFK